MPSDQKPIAAEKENLHPRNAHRYGYNYKQLIKSTPELARHIKFDELDAESINFSDAIAVKTLNKALLKHFYGINDWDIPEGYLCPPVPGRADYIHYVADLLGEMDNGIIPKGKKMNVLDIGAGANCIYPAIGSSVYGWRFVGIDIDPVAIGSAKRIVSANDHLKDKVIFRQQTNKHNIFKGIVLKDEGFDVTICNPPFHASAQEAQLAAINKWNKLKPGERSQVTQNFGGQRKELWYPGGEAAFIRLIVEQSALVAKQCMWFTTLVSKKDTLPGVYRSLKKIAAKEVKTILMSQGQKHSRLVAWTFLDPAEQAAWVHTWWHKA